MLLINSFLLLCLFGKLSLALRFDKQYIGYNLNENATAVDPLDYAGEWPDHTYNLSPTNWRFPFYTLFIDKFVNGDPTNDDINGTAFEHDIMQTQLRHGGDLQGIIDSLDYIQGIGIKGIYIAGSPFINEPWGSDAYSPLDFTLLDQHFGNIEMWRSAITEIHQRGMYVVMDHTMSTMGDLIASDGFLNASTPFTLSEHKVQWRNSDRQYLDFRFGNTYNKTCQYPRFWNESGYPVGSDVTDQMVGCYDSEFDQYGDIEAFGVFADWQRQLAKFASVQDRLREWVPSVRAKLEHFSCITIMMLDIDGFRLDKATQITVDALGDFGHSVRECARRVGKQNFFIAGEIAGGNTFGSIYLGRGRQPDMVPQTLLDAVTTKNTSNSSMFIRDEDNNALDAAVFHYSVYRALTRLLGMDGNLTSGYDTPVNFVDAWNTMLSTNDLVNANTGVFDPRHMYGVSNQDVFRWPAIANGTEKMLLGMFITTLMMPGIPLLLWGEEQAFYALDNTAGNYLFGRQAMSSSQAWEIHSCYSLGSSQYNNFPLGAAAHGCEDDWNSLDHRDPTSPVRNIVKSMYQMRENYPALNDGWFLQQLSNQTHNIYLPGSNGTPTETGMWSIMRGHFAPVQDLSGEGKGNQSVWLLYQNDDQTIDYKFDCSSNETALISPFDTKTVVKNLYYPYDELTLKDGPIKLGIYGSEKLNGCLDDLSLAPWEFRAYVPKSSYVATGPMVTKFVPGHDARLQSSVTIGEQETVAIEFHFSAEMDCKIIASTLQINSTTEDGTTATLDENSATCDTTDPIDLTSFIGGVATQWTFKANLVNVSNGVHALTLKNITTKDASTSTGTTDHFLFRIGQPDNPMVFPKWANYTRDLLFQYSNKSLYVSHKAAGADQFRYSLNWGSSYSAWQPYTGTNTTLAPKQWSGTSLQDWDGEHVIMQYYNSMTGSSDHIQHADLGQENLPARRFPHLFLNGPFNQYGFDGGLLNNFNLKDNGLWVYNFMTEWPTSVQVNEWGVNPDGQPDQTGVFGDVDKDNILDRMPPSSLAPTLLNITTVPPSPYLAWQLTVNDATYRYDIVPVGNRYSQLIMYCVMWVLPVVSAALGVWAFMLSFYKVKFNRTGVSNNGGLIPFSLRRKFKQSKGYEQVHSGLTKLEDFSSHHLSMTNTKSPMQASVLPLGKVTVGRRTVLIATMEYDIEDWAIKIKIGGLGVMAQLMGKNLGHQDLIWVVPCVGGIDYPEDQRAEPMEVTILGKPYEILVQYHTLRNITYVLLDSEVFRAQSKSEPYPPRMDDLDSAIYYSAWNQCIALTIKRFPIDLYHINDYHGAVAPVHLLPQTIPCCLSLHNAEFQGLWPMRTPKERQEVAEVYNISPETVEKYVQFGDVFNLLHAGSSYLRIHQKGFGAVGVSKKYGKRSWARYPIFWGLSKIGNLPNPDPSDTAAWSGEQDEGNIVIDEEFEKGRGELRRQAQEWAGLDQNPNAELLVFVGRWSMQKGIDLIADVMPAVLEEKKNVQLICVGPVIDLYGKFAALKLDVMMKKYPGRVFSKPEFTALPPFIFSGAEFALIPSRDEPFGLVAVEFGRKGALGIGARVGGLGQMPGWWFTVESTTTSHMLHQFKTAIKEALASKLQVRKMMRARSAKQRFPVAQWVEDLETLQTTAIKIHQKEASHVHGESYTSRGRNRLRRASRVSFSSARSISPPREEPVDMYGNRRGSAQLELNDMHDRTPSPARIVPPGVGRTLSLGIRAGPGHAAGSRSLMDRSNSPANGPRIRVSTIQDADDEGAEDDSHEVDPEEYIVTPEEIAANRERDSQAVALRSELLGHTPDFVAIPPRSLQQSPSNNSEPETTAPRLEDNLLQPTTPLYNRRRSSSNLSVTSVDEGLLPPPSPFYNQNRNSSTLSVGDEGLLPPASPFYNQKRNSSNLSLNAVVGDHTDFKLQQVDPNFTDSNEEYFKAFEESLQKLDGSNSEGLLCIQEYLVKSEKSWFDEFRAAKLGRRRSPSPNPDARRLSRSRGRSPSASPGPSLFRRGRPSGSRERSFIESRDASPVGSIASKEGSLDQFLLGDGYKPPTGIKLVAQYRIGDWPIYSIFLAFGQIIAANSYQITLLSGTIKNDAERFYIIATIYLVSSIAWWLVFRLVKSIYVLSVPFVFYGLAFLLLGMSPLVHSVGGKSWMSNVASGMYATASSSGSLFFALNFGDEGGSPIKAWVYRACVIQGTQQIYLCALWFWGDYLTRLSNTGVVGGLSFNTSSITMTIVMVPVAFVLFGVGLLIYLGLPDYYRQEPGKVPSFYPSLFRRKIIVWFFVAVIIQNYFLSTLYGRNFQYLWSSSQAPVWQIALLIVFFFVIVWSIFLWVFGLLSKRHSWILPVFAIGLGAPRWAQELWGCSNIGMYVPWAGSPLASALVGRSLWLWLGVLDALQGVGFGMILLQTLTRIHISFTLIAAEVIGTITTMLARATLPSKIGPTGVFPDFSAGAMPGLIQPWFWVGLGLQLCVCAGFFLFFRKEQLSKP